MKTVDNLSTVSVALPAAAASANTAGIRVTGGKTVGPVGDALEVRISVPALPNLATGKSLTIALQHSADNTNWEALPFGAGLSLTGAQAAPKTWRGYLPPDCKTFIRAQASVETSGGDNTAASLTLALAV